MKTILILITGFIAFANPEPIMVKNVNIEESVITWKGYKVLGSHEGTLKLKDGNLEMKDGMLIGGTFTIDMTSMACTDLEGENAQNLVGHLSSPDFFSTESFPTASLNITKVVSRGAPGDYKILADLTIKETTQPIKFNAQVTEDSATADIEIDRTQFDVRYGSGSFFDGLGDKTIYDEFELNVNVVLK